jgi:hypothetical protein
MMKRKFNFLDTPMKLIVGFFPIVLIGGCSKLTHVPSGLATWEDVHASAEAFVLRGNSDAILDHTDTSGVPTEKVQQIKLVLADWHGPPGTLTCTSTQVMTFAEYQVLQRDEKKELPEDMRNAVLSSIEWNVKPEKVIVFKFDSKDPSEKASVTYSAGAYRTNDLWWFATSYSK